MPPVIARVPAVAAVIGRVVGLDQAADTVTAMDVKQPRIADAMGPGRVRVPGHSTRRPPLHRQQHAVVAGRAAGVDIAQVAEFVADARLRVFQLKPPAIVAVARRGTRPPDPPAAKPNPSAWQFPRELSGQEPT